MNPEHRDKQGYPSLQGIEAIVRNRGGLAWHDLLLALAGDGIEVSLTYSPKEQWPHEAEDKPAYRRWTAWATTVPGTDMCQYIEHGSSPTEVLTRLHAAIYGVRNEFRPCAL